MADHRCKHCQDEIHQSAYGWRAELGTVICPQNPNNAWHEPEDAAPAPKSCPIPTSCDHAEMCLRNCDEGFVMDGFQQTPGKPGYDPTFGGKLKRQAEKGGDAHNPAIRPNAANITPATHVEAGARVAGASQWPRVSANEVRGYECEPVAQPGAGGARRWKYPEDVPLPVAEHVTFPAQSLIIAANPDDQKLPWAVILEDRREMYDIAELSFSGNAIGKTDWSADNYWYPRMWIEISGVLTIEGSRARIEPAAGQVGAEPETLNELWDAFIQTLTVAIPLTPKDIAIRFAAHVTKGLEADLEYARKSFKFELNRVAEEMQEWNRRANGYQSRAEAAEARNLELAKEVVFALDQALAYLHLRIEQLTACNLELMGELERHRQILDLIATDELFIQPAEGGGWVFWVNVNDMFYPAADGEGIDISAIPELWKVWKEGAWPAVVRWVQEKRGGLPLRKSREETITSMESLQRRLAEAEKALENMIDSAVTDSDSCVICGGDVGKCSPGCAIELARAALKPEEKT